MKSKVNLATLILGLLSVGFAQADSGVLQSSVPDAPEGYQSEIEELTQDKIVQFTWLVGNEDEYYVVEIDIGGALVAGFKNVFRSMTTVVPTEEIGGHTFVLNNDGYMTLIEKTLIVRVYGTVSSEVQLEAISRMDLVALSSLARAQ